MSGLNPYVPDYKTVSDGGSDYFDGSESSTGAAVLASITANFDAEVFYEASNDDGTSWTEISQLTTEEGDNLFSAEWHSQGNRMLVVEGNRRLRVDNVDSVAGEVAVDGDEV